MSAAAVGFRIRSGRAIAVLLAGSRKAPSILDCREVTLADPAVPASVQPYHAALRQHRLTNMRAAERLVQVVERASEQSVAALLVDYRALTAPILNGAVVVGSLIDPEKIANQHMRAHALEGRLFRVVVEQALAAAGVTVFPILERSAYETVASSLSRTPDELKQAVTLMGKTRSGPWRADEKLATVGAWAALIKEHKH